MAWPFLDLACAGLPAGFTAVPGAGLRQKRGSNFQTPTAMRTAHRLKTGDPLQEGSDGFNKRRFRPRHAQRRARRRQAKLLSRWREQAIVPNAFEAAGQDAQQETTDELAP